MKGSRLTVWFDSVSQVSQLHGSGNPWDQVGVGTPLC